MTKELSGCHCIPRLTFTIADEIFCTRKICTTASCFVTALPNTGRNRTTFQLLPIPPTAVSPTPTWQEDITNVLSRAEPFKTSTIT